MFTIAARELRSLFLSPLAWSILAVVQFILAFIFLSQVDSYLRIQGELAYTSDPIGFTDIISAGLFGTAGVILMLISPLLTMRLISEERRNRTLSLLLSAPVSMLEIVLGKYLGLMVFFALMLSLTALMPLSLLTGGMLDLGQFGAGLLGLFLLSAAFGAVGLYISTLTSHPTVAAISSFGAILLLWVINWAGETAGQSGLFAYLSITNHYESLLRGVFKSEDIVYYVLFIAVFLILSVRRLDAERLQ